MTRRTDRDKVDGWLILDKPAGITSAAAVGRAKRLFNASKVGHAGTLDPMATGVLPLAFGEATKTVPYVMDADKTYRFTVRWGAETATDDSEGQVTATSPARPSREQILAILPLFHGEVLQVPPVYSAIAVGGRRAYQRARAGEEVELPPRHVRIERLVLEGLVGPDRAVFFVRCGKGTYVRSLARDMARALGTLGHLVALRRLAVGRFDETVAIPLAKLETLGHSAAALAHLQPVETALDDIPALAVTEAECLRLRQGQSVRVAQGAPGRQGGSPDASRLVRARLVEGNARGRLVALAVLENDVLRPLRLINL
jgi:tRNA pseudouridine55 synthase